MNQPILEKSMYASFAVRLGKPMTVKKPIYVSAFELRPGE